MKKGELFTMNFNKVIFNVFVFGFLIINLSCVSFNEKNKTSGIITGYVYDENNNPVSGMSLTLVKNGLKSDVSYSDEKGFFSFMNVISGQYEIYGKKSGYSILNETFTICDDFDLYCFPVTSAQSVFDKCDELIKNGAYKEAVSQIEKIHTENNPILKSVQKFYFENLKKIIKNEKRGNDFDNK